MDALQKNHEDWIARKIFALRTRLLDLKASAATRKESEERLWEVEDDCRRILETVNALSETTHARTHERRRVLLRELQEEIALFRKWRQSLVVCPFCDRAIDRDGNWVLRNSPAKESSKTAVRHCICPDCLKKLYPESYLG